MRFVHDIIQRVEVILTAVAMPFDASVLFHVVQSPARIIVSVVIAMVITPADVSFMNVTAVPIGNATELFAGIVQVLAVVSADG